MTFSAENLDLVGILVATGAVLLSFATVVQSRRQRRHDVFLRIQEILSEEQMQYGRWLLYRIAHGEPVAIGSRDSGIIYRTLRMHNTVAIYVRKRLVPKRWVLDAWHHSLRDMKKGAQIYLSQGDTRTWYVWSELSRLIAKAERYRTSMPCCRYEATRPQPSADSALSVDPGAGPN